MAISELLIALLAIFAAAKVFGELEERIGQPAVLGEMIGGIVIGVSGLHLVDAHDPLLHVLSELGVLLLFLIGLETDIQRLLAVGGASLAVAAAGVVLPFAAGYGVGMWLAVGGTLQLRRADGDDYDFRRAARVAGVTEEDRACTGGARQCVVRRRDRSDGRR